MAPGKLDVHGMLLDLEAPWFTAVRDDIVDNADPTSSFWQC